VHVVDKATKLQTLFDRIHLVDTRFEVLKRDAEIHAARQLGTARGDPTRAGEGRSEDLAAPCGQIDSDRDFLRQANIGSEAMQPSRPGARPADRQQPTAGATSMAIGPPTSSAPTNSKTSPSAPAR
jgi:hypothetical protein